MDAAGIINTLLQQGFINQEDEEKTFVIDAAEHGGFEIRAGIYGNRWDLILGDGEDSTIAIFERWNDSSYRQPSVEIFNQEGFQSLLKLWEEFDCKK